MHIIKWETYLLTNPILKKAVEVLKLLSIHGTAYIVGGTVRDLLLNRIPKDIDICTNVPMELIEQMFPTHDIGANKDFGILVIEYKGEHFEIAQFRTDSIYSDHRRPDSVKIVDTFLEDSKRRDFTINAMAVDCDGNVIDYHEGLKDIKKHIIRTVGEPRKRFSEDDLRMLRAVRFANMLNMKIHKDTYETIQEYSPNITSVSQERITAEILRMASQTGKCFAKAIKLLKETYLLKYIIPEIDVMDQFEHGKTHHPEGNVYQHTLAALKENQNQNVLINMSILYHDIGKPDTFEFKDGKHTFHQHDQIGAKIIENLSKKRRWSKELTECMAFCAKNHMKIHDIRKMKNSKIIKMMNNKYFDYLVNVSICDDRCRKGVYKEEHTINMLKKISDVVYDGSNNDPLTEIKKVVSGKRVMKVRGIIKPCKEIGDIIKKTVTWIADENIDLNNIEEIEKYIKDINI